MALTILKNTPIHTVVAVSGAGTETIDLAETLKTAFQTPSTPVVHIRSILFSVPVGNATITRNSVALWTLTLSDELQFNGYSDNRQATSNIAVTIPGGGGTVILELLKVSGYGDSQHLNQNIGVLPTTTTTEEP